MIKYLRIVHVKNLLFSKVVNKVYAKIIYLSGHNMMIMNKVRKYFLIAMIVNQSIKMPKKQTLELESFAVSSFLFV